MSTFPTNGICVAIWDPNFQVITFDQPAMLVEVLMGARCRDGNRLSAWLESVTADGKPSGMRLRNATVVAIERPPTRRTAASIDGFDPRERGRALVAADAHADLDQLPWLREVITCQYATRSR